MEATIKYHYLIEIVADKYPRVAAKQTHLKTERRNQKDRPPFSDAKMAQVTSDWLVVQTKREFDTNQRVRRYKLADADLLEASSSRVESFFDNLKPIN